jgi:hypothetical protein
MLSQTFEEGEELVVGSITTGLSVERINRVEKPLLRLTVDWGAYASFHSKTHAVQRSRHRFELKGCCWGCRPDGKTP